LILLTRGCNGFDGDFETRDSHPQRQLRHQAKPLKTNDNNYAYAA